MKKRINRGRQQRKKLRHVSIFAKRDQFNPLERSFHETWQHENVPCPGLNGGWGLLQNILLIPLGGKVTRQYQWWEGERRAFIINQRDATIAATLIQWLGTNGGYHFLNRCLRKDGYEIRELPGRVSRQEELYERFAERPPQKIPGASQIVREIKSIPEGQTINLYGLSVTNGSWSGRSHFYVHNGWPREELSPVRIAKRIIAAEAGRKGRINLP